MESLESKKLYEIEMLMSIYPKEFQLDDLECFLVLKETVENPFSDVTCFNRRIRYTIKLDSIKKDKVEVTFDLPSKYPEEFPDISLRSNNGLSNKTIALVMSDLKCFMKENIPEGEACVLAIVQWINDKIDNYFDNEPIFPTSDIQENKYIRYWIYSHHIYNKMKRKTILDSAKKLNLTGFSCPGKPGIICVEGLEGDVDEFWQEIRNLQWKKIMLKHQESLSGDVGEATWSRSFKTFEEKCFLSDSCRDAHTDVGALLKFLQENNVQHIFQFYFGISGSLTSEDD